MSSRGVGVEELHEIEREQFLHYVQLARVQQDPSDWEQFRRELLRALVAAYALDTVRVDRDPSEERRRVDRRFRAALEAVDGARDEADPATRWPAFLDALWTRASGQT